MPISSSAASNIRVLLEIAQPHQDALLFVHRLTIISSNPPTDSVRIAARRRRTQFSPSITDVKETVLSIWLQNELRLLPMIELKINAAAGEILSIFAGASGITLTIILQNLRYRSL